jgi:hypothetical protein
MVWRPYDCQSTSGRESWAPSTPIQNNAALSRRRRREAGHFAMLIETASPPRLSMSPSRLAFK